MRGASRAMLKINRVTSESDRNEKLILSVVKNGTGEKHLL